MMTTTSECPWETAASQAPFVLPPLPKGTERAFIKNNEHGLRGTLHSVFCPDQRPSHFMMWETQPGACEQGRALTSHLRQKVWKHNA